MQAPTFNEIYKSTEKSGGGVQNFVNPGDLSFNSVYEKTSDYDSLPLVILQSPMMQFWSYVSFFISLPFLISILYFLFSIWIIRIKERKRMYNEPLSLAGTLLFDNAPNNAQTPVSDQFEKLKQEASSDDEQTRKMAVISADVLLDEVLNKLGYTKGSVGEKLKAVPSNAYPEIEHAWDAHKIRNKIAHEKDYKLTKEKAKSAIRKYLNFIEAALRDLEE